MIKKLNLFIAALCFLCFTVQAQDSEDKKTYNLMLGFEIGADGYFGETMQSDRLRENRSYYHVYDDYDYYCGIVGNDQYMNVVYFGVKPEVFVLNNRLGISSGVRFSRYLTNIESDRDYFLWLLHQEGLNTEYVTIKEIEQNSHYIGIPLELQFFPDKRELPFQHYFKLGTVFNYRLYTENKIEFHNQQMSRHEGLVDSQIGYPNDFNAYIFGAFGFRIGRYGGEKKLPYINLEVHLPKVMITPKASSLIKTHAGFGFQMMVQIPLGETVPIGSK